MSFWRKIARSNFLIKVKNPEYWPFGIIQFPAAMYWLWLSLRARSFVFFSASNPGIPMGGMFGESKYDVLNKIPHQIIPKMLLIHPPATVSEVVARIREADMKLPLIFKPDIGERGILVKRINDEREMKSYLEQMQVSFLVQEWVQLPMEFGVFYMRMPTDKWGKVISVVAKEMLSVTGDGNSTLRQLILDNERAKLQWKKLRITYREKLDAIPARGENLELVSIGNHCMGTRFINANHLINDRLSNTFDKICSRIPGFYFGRFDLRCASLEALYQGRVKIMELNGCGAEPGHIYDRNLSLWEALKVPVVYWRHIFQIARANNKNGVKYVGHREAIAYYRKFRSALK